MSGDAWRTGPRAALHRAVIVLVVLLTACASAPTQIEDARLPAVGQGAPAGLGGGTFQFAAPEPSAITPASAVGTTDLQVVDQLYDSLTRWDAQGIPRPSAAESWRATQPDATEWTFNLRGGATFHDGTPVTPEAFISAWHRLAATGTYGYLLADVTGIAAARAGDESALAIEVVDPTTFRVSLDRPRADFPVLVGHPALGPLNTAQVGVEALAVADQPSGNGPFAMTEPWSRGDFIRMAAWDGWRNGARAADTIDEVVFRFADLDISYLAFTQGRRDLATVPNEALDLAATRFGSTEGWDGPGLITGGRPEAYVLGLNPSVAPYDARAVREAVSLVLDRPELAQALEGGNLTPATSLLPPGVAPSAETTCMRCRLDLPAARRLLDDADVTTLSFAYNARGGHERVRDALRAQLGRVDVGLVANGGGVAPELGEYQSLLATGTVGLFRMPLAADVPSALSVLTPLLHSSQTPDRGGLNAMGYADPQVDALLEQAAATLDPGDRDLLLSRVTDLAVNRDQVVIPVFSFRHAVVVDDGVENLRYGPFDDVNLEQVVLGP